MAFERGRAKSGGRVKGTPNKRTVALLSIRDSLAAKSFDLGAEVLKLVSSTLDDSIRLKALELLAKYTQVVPTAEEADTSEDAVDEQLREMTTEELLTRVGASPQ